MVVHQCHGEGELFRTSSCIFNKLGPTRDLYKRKIALCAGVNSDELPVAVEDEDNASLLPAVTHMLTLKLFGLVSQLCFATTRLQKSSRKACHA